MERDPSLACGQPEVAQAWKPKDLMMMPGPSRPGPSSRRLVAFAQR